MHYGEFMLIHIENDQLNDDKQVNLGDRYMKYSTDHRHLLIFPLRCRRHKTLNMPSKTNVFFVLQLRF